MDKYTHVGSPLNKEVQQRHKVNSSNVNKSQFVAKFNQGIEHSMRMYGRE